MFFLLSLIFTFFFVVLMGSAFFVGLSGNYIDSAILCFVSFVFLYYGEKFVELDKKCGIIKKYHL